MDDYWKKLAKKGDLEARLLRTIEDYFNNLITKFSENFQKIGINKPIELFIDKINKKLDNIFNQFDSLNIQDKKKRKTIFIHKLKKTIDHVISKKALCIVKFPSYHLYQFFLAFSSLVNEIEFNINKNQIKARGLISTKNLLIELILKNNKSYTFFRNGKIKLDLNDLARILKSNKNDKSTTKMIFGESNLYVSIKSKVYNSLIKRRINQKSFESEDSFSNRLRNINYNCHFSISKIKYEYLLKNLDIFSNNILINLKSDRIIFSEASSNGKGEIIWTKEDIEDIKINSTNIHDKYKKTDNNSKNTENMLNNYNCLTSHSLVYLRSIVKLCRVLDSSDTITFKIKHAYSTMVEIIFKQ